jgi:putative hemolysin
MDLVVIFFLILLNGLFAMSEMSIVSARKARLHQWADEGRQGAAAALQLANEPSHFLSTVQIGITSIGILSGAFGERAIADHLSAYFAEVPLIAPYAHGLALGITVVVITYVSVIIGELVPKRLALLDPERIAGLIARPMQWLSRATAPLVRFLTASSELVLRLFPSKGGAREPVNDAEINVLMVQGAHAGVFEKGEPALVSNILGLDELRVGALMTPRLDMHYVDLDAPEEEVRRQIITSPDAVVPVCRGGVENVIGMLQAQDLLEPCLSGQTVNIERALRPPLYLPDTLSATRVLEAFKKHRAQVALVVDEYGHLLGMVSLIHVLEAIVGDLPRPGELESEAVQREDGSWLVEGMIPISRFKQLLGIGALPDEDEGDFHTLAGFVMAQLGRVPHVTDSFEASGLRFEVVDMDRNRVDKVLVMPSSSRPETGE